MTFAEIDALVHHHLGQHRLYDSRSVEDMRNALARFGALNSKMAADLHSKDCKIAAVSGLVETLRREGNYAVSDQLRKALEGQS